MFRELCIFFKQKLKKTPLNAIVPESEYERQLRVAAKMPEARDEDNLTPEETVTLYSGKCPACDGPLYNGPRGSGAINLGCPLSQGGCGAKYWEGAPFRPMKLTGIVE